VGGGWSVQVHFIVRHENPVSHKVSEHHFTKAGYPGDMTMTRLLTLIVRPDDTFTILLDQVR
jgi:calnexin